MFKPIHEVIRLGAFGQHPKPILFEADKRDRDVGHPRSRSCPRRGHGCVAIMIRPIFEQMLARAQQGLKKRQRGPNVHRVQFALGLLNQLGCKIGSSKRIGIII